MARQLKFFGPDQVKRCIQMSRWPPGVCTLLLTPGEEIKALREGVDKVLTENSVKNVDLRSGPLTIAKRAPDDEMPNGGIVAMWYSQDLYKTEEESDGDEDVSEDEDESADESADEKRAVVGCKPKHLLYLLSREQIKGEPLLWNEKMLGGNCGKTVAGFLLAYNAGNDSLEPELIRWPLRRTSLMKFIARLNGDNEDECVVCYATVASASVLKGANAAKSCVKCAVLVCDECIFELVIDSEYRSKKAKGRVLRCPVCGLEQDANFMEMIESVKIRVVSESMKEFVKFWTHLSDNELEKAVLCVFTKMTAKMRATIREDIDRQFFDVVLSRMKYRTEVGGFGQTKAEWREGLKYWRKTRASWKPLLFKQLNIADSGGGLIVALGNFDKKKQIIEWSSVQSEAFDPRTAVLPVTAEMLPAVAKMHNVKFFPLERMDDRSVVKASSERVAVGSVERGDRCARCQKAFWDKKEQMRAPKCAKCKRTAYCSTQCRKKHRVVHSRVCKGKKKRKKKI